MSSPGGNVDPSGGESSFWADRMAEACPPFRYGKLEVPPPDDLAVAALDECQDWQDDLDTLVGEAVAEQFLDAVDDAGDLPALAVDDLLDHFHLLRAPSTGWHLLVERINVYGAGIEYDLDSGPFRYGLHDYFTGRVPGGWDHLWRMVHRLPMGSHFRSAVADDDELARQILELEGPAHKRKKGSGRPPLAGFTLDTSYLHRIDNRLRYVAWAVFAAQAGKRRSSPPKDLKGPETADERVEFLDFLREHDEVVSQVLVRKGGTKNTSSHVLGRDGAEVERPVPGEASRKGVMLPRAFGDDDEDEQRPQRGPHAVGQSSPSGIENEPGKGGGEQS